VEQVHRSFRRPRRTAVLDGPIWWLGPIVILGVLTAGAIALTFVAPLDTRAPAAKVEPARVDSSAYASSRMRWRED